MKRRTLLALPFAGLFAKLKAKFTPNKPVEPEPIGFLITNPPSESDIERAYIGALRFGKSDMAMMEAATRAREGQAVAIVGKMDWDYVRDAERYGIIGKENVSWIFPDEN